MSTFTPDPVLDLHFERIIPVSPEKVWAAWTQPELMVQWFTPAPWKTVLCDVDVRPGGRFYITMESPEGEQFPEQHKLHSASHSEPPIIFSSVMGEGFRPTAPSNGAGDLPFTARVSFEPAADGGTLYAATAMHADAEGSKRHAEMGFHEGWGAALDQLVALMS